MLVAGCDLGSATGKAVIMDGDAVLSSAVVPATTNPSEPCAARWRISATNAALSASRFARELAESTSRGSPLELIMRGYVLGLVLIHSGT